MAVVILVLTCALFSHLAMRLRENSHINKQDFLSKVGTKKLPLSDDVWGFLVNNFLIVMEYFKVSGPHFCVGRIWSRDFCAVVTCTWFSPQGHR